mgnify:CR=1 FL=1
MSETFEQGWAARPFSEQFPELSVQAAARLDNVNKAITELLISGMITDSQTMAIRQKKFPKMVLREVKAAREVKP